MTKIGKIQTEYILALKSGMFFEFFPELTGEWKKDKDLFGKIYRKIMKERKTPPCSGHAFESE